MKLGFIGGGKMGGALIEGVLSAGMFRSDQVFVSDAHAGTLDNLVNNFDIVPVETNVALAKQVDTIVLCVKPNEVVSVLEGISEGVAGKLVISIAAGVTIARLQTAAWNTARIVRVMPNTPVLIAKGAAAYARGENATDADAEFVQKLFSAVGIVVEVKEPLLDAVTGLSGSGPAYIYLVIEALTDGGVLMGLPRDIANKLAAQTVAGAAEMVLQTRQHPAELKGAVTSPGGTTIAGIEALEEAGLRAAMISAVRAATERARELGGGQ